MKEQEDLRQPYLVWVNPASLAEKLDAATWLQTTWELRRLGWRVMLVCYGAADCRDIDGIEVHCIPTPQIFMLRQVLFHLQFIKLAFQQRRAIDVVLFHSMSMLWILPLRLFRWMCRENHPLFAMDIRTLHMEPPNRDNAKDQLRKSYLNLMMLLAKRWADGLLAITPRMVSALTIPASKLWGTWPSGVDTELFGKSVNLRSWPHKNDSIKLIYIGSLNYERNLMTLSKAVAQANAANMCFELMLMGSGTQENTLRGFADTTAGAVRVKPPVPHDQVPYELAKAHVGVLPFPDEEKFRVSSAIKLFEYMAAGLPILATSISAHTDVISDDSYVTWVEGSDEQALLSGLRALWNKHETLRQMGLNASLAAHQWTWHESAKKLKAALETGLRLHSLDESG